MARATRGEQTRSDILQAAIRLFSLHGYFQTSTSDILEAANISKGAFYHHFKSKEELALAALEQLRSDYQKSLIKPVKAVEPNHRFTEMITRIVELNRSGQWPNCLLLARFIQEMSQQDTLISERVIDIVNWLIKFWQEIISDAQNAGSVKKNLDPLILAQFVLSCFCGAITCNELDEKIIQLDEIAEHIKAILKP